MCGTSALTDSEPMNAIASEQHARDVSRQAATEIVSLPRITIEFCTQCRWMLRAAYVSRSIDQENMTLP